MRIERLILSVLIVVVSALAIVNWRKAALFARDNDDLRARIESLETEAEASEQALKTVRNNSAKNRSQTSELMQLRNEVTKLRTENQNTGPLAAENQKLKAELAQFRSMEQANDSDPDSKRATGRDQFPRESWSFAGYASPETALISAIWAMKEGNPETYLNSLTPQEQERIAAVWQNKSETEIAEKHKNDVAAIAGVRILERESLSPSEVVMNVFLEGPGRVEKIRMHQVGQDWKFGGFIREQPAP